MGQHGCGVRCASDPVRSWPVRESDMKCRSSIAAFLSLGVLIAGAGPEHRSAEGQAPDLLGILADELDYSMEKLVSPEGLRPYFVAYSVTDTQAARWRPSWARWWSSATRGSVGWTWMSGWATTSWTTRTSFGVSAAAIAPGLTVGRSASKTTRSPFAIGSGWRPTMLSRTP